MKIKLAALCPPSNIDRIVVGLQNRIFERFGLVSALALPVMIPISIHSAAMTRTDFLESLGGSTRGFSLRSSSYGLNKGSLFLRVDTDDRGKSILKGIGQALASLFPPTGDLPIPIDTGFFLATAENGTDLDRIADFLRAPPRLHFSVFTYNLFQISIAEPVRTWWHSVYWEIIEEVKVRRYRSK